MYLVCMLKCKILIQARLCFTVSLFRISFQSWPLYLRFKGAAFLKDTFSQFCFDIRRVSSRLQVKFFIVDSRSWSRSVTLFTRLDKYRYSIHISNGEFLA